MKVDGDEAISKQEIDAVMLAFFRAVSFQATETPTYDTLYNLFITMGLLIKSSIATPEVSTVSEFINPRQQLVESGELKQFRETEITEITEIFGNVAHRFSIYAKEGINTSGTFRTEGMISTQFVYTETGWKISVMAWDDERAGLSIPARYRLAHTGGKSIGRPKPR